MKISIFGIGRVGSTLAYTLAMKGVGDELVLVNRRRQIADGEAADLRHMQCFLDKSIDISAGGIEDTAGSDIIVLSCSIPVSIVESRDELGPANVALLRSCVPRLAELSPEAIMVVLSNPVDVLTWYTLQLSGFPVERVLGSGTIIDSARYRHLLSQEHGIHPVDIRAYILGEHGDSQFAADSSAMAGGELMDDKVLAQRLFTQAVASGYEVYQAKGYTNFAVAMAASLIIESIVNNEQRTMPISIALTDCYGVSDVCLSVPVVVGAGGVERILKPSLSIDELALFQESATVVQAAIAAAAGADVDVDVNVT